MNRGIPANAFDMVYYSLPRLVPVVFILDRIALRPPKKQELLHAQLLQYQQTLLAHSEVLKGMVELLGNLEALGLPTALLTNNHRIATNIALQKHSLAFAQVLTCEDAPPQTLTSFDAACLNVLCPKAPRGAFHWGLRR